MKRIRKFGLLGMAIAVFALASCDNNSKQEKSSEKNNSSTPVTATQPEKTISESTVQETDYAGYFSPEYIPEDYTMVDMSRVKSNTRLSSVAVDTTNAKTEYNMGEKFDSTGLVVTANYVTTTYDEEKGDYVHKASSKVVNTGFYFDTQYVNFDDSGTYPVTCYYREGSTIVNRSFNIIVRSSVLVESGVQYNAGLELQYDNNHLTTYTVLVNDTWTMPTVGYFVHQYVGTEEVGSVSKNKKAITIDDSAVDTSKEGNYIVKATYPGTVKINGQTVDNTIKAFFIVSVTNPVIGCEWQEGETTLEANPVALDTSSWKISITKTVAGTDEVVTYSDDEFTISGIDQYTPGTYTATIKLKANKSFSFQKEITIVESTKYTMTRFLEFGNLLPEGYLDNETTEAITLAKDTNIGDLGVFYSAANVVVEEHKPAADKFTGGYNSFHARYKISGAGNINKNNIRVEMTGAGYITLYFATGSEGVERTMNLLNSAGEIIESCSTKGYIAYTYTINEAGSYYLTSQSAGLNIYGIVVSYAKEA